jgi:hypothetical protein
MTLVDETQPSTANDKKIISRLILQKVMSSSATKYLRKDCYKAVSAAFLSEEPDNDFTLMFKHNVESSSYNDNIVDITVGWERGDKELQDLDGNVWVTYGIKIRPTMTHCYSLSATQFIQRAECIGFVSELVTEILDMTANPIRVIALNNTQRIERDKIRRIDAAKHLIVSILNGEGKSLRTHLRIDGRGRAVPREHVTLFDPGSYTLEIPDGWKGRKAFRTKKYSLTIPENPNYSAFIKRIA